MTYVDVVLRERGIDALMAVVDVITITIDGMHDRRRPSASCTANRVLAFKLVDRHIDGSIPDVKPCMPLDPCGLVPVERVSRARLIRPLQRAWQR